MNFTSIGFPQIVFIRMLSVSCAVLLQWIIPAFSGYTPRPRVSPLGIRVDPVFAGWLWRIQAWNTIGGRPRVYGVIQVGVRLRNLAVDPAFGGGLSHQPMADPKGGRPPRLRGCTHSLTVQTVLEGATPRLRGVPPGSVRPRVPAEGDPRGCGVYCAVLSTLAGYPGRSPRLRGGLWRALSDNVALRETPVSAGPTIVVAPQ